MNRLAFLLAFALLGGCSRAPGKDYPLDAATVAARVQATEVPMLIFADVPVTARIVPVLEQSPNRVEWIVRRPGSELFRYVATITPEKSAKRGLRYRLNRVAISNPQ